MGLYDGLGWPIGVTPTKTPTAMDEFNWNGLLGSGGAASTALGIFGSLGLSSLQNKGATIKLNYDTQLAALKIQYAGNKQTYLLKKEQLEQLRKKDEQDYNKEVAKEKYIFFGIITVLVLGVATTIYAISRPSRAMAAQAMVCPHPTWTSSTSSSCSSPPH